MRSRWERLGLRARIALVFAFGALLLSVTIAVVTLAFTRQNLLSEREESAFAAFTANARRVQNQLNAESDSEAVQAAIQSLTITAGAFPLVRFDDAWTAGTGLVFNEDNLPAELRAVVEAGNAARMRATVDSAPAIVNGVLLPSEQINAAYYEAVKLDDVENTLSSLGFVIAAAAAAATMLAAALGAWAARRTLSPLGDVRRAAESLAAGELDTRLDPPADADLASLTASFNGMARSLEDRIERDARFASEVSHELRSPLMTLSASLEVLNNNRESMPDRSQTALDLLNDDVARFTQLVQDLLEISRFDVGSASLELEPLGVVEFVRQAISHSTRPDADVVATPEMEEEVVAADKRRLAQVLANLIDNADKYGDGAIEVQLSRWEDIFFIAVEDEGPGVPPDERARVFDRFSRGRAGGRRGYDTGSGLGLSLVAEHVGLHGGGAWVEDRLDGRSGARFVIALPIGEITDEDET